MEIDVTHDYDATAAVEFVTLVDLSAETGANNNSRNLIGQGRKQHHALRQQAKRRRKNTTIATSGGCGGATSTLAASHCSSIPRIIVRPLPPQPTQLPADKYRRSFTAVQPMEEVTVSTTATILPLRTMPTMREVLASIPGFSIKAPKKRNNKKLSAAVQLEQTKEGCIDLETPDSILVNTNLRSLLNKYTFSLLPPLYQHKLVQLLPTVDRQVISNTNDSLRLQPSSLNNEFFARACLEWQERLAEGEFTPEHQQKLKSEADRERSKLDPWKLKHFEPIWGDRSRYLLYDLTNDPSLLLHQQQSRTSTAQQQEGRTGNSNLRPPIKTTIKLRPSTSLSHNSFTQVRSASLRNRHCNSSCYSASKYNSGSTSTASSSSLNSSPVKRLRTVGAMTRSCTSSYYTPSESLTSSLSSTDKALDIHMPPTVTCNSNVRGSIPDLLPIRGTRSTAAAIAVATSASASVLKATEVLIPHIQHGSACTKEVDPLLLPDSLQQAATQEPSSSSMVQQLLHQHLPHSSTSASSSTRAHHLTTNSINTCQPSIAGIHLPEISIINITETIMPQSTGSSGSRTPMDIGNNLRTSITITKTGGLCAGVVSGDKKRRRSRSRNNRIDLEGGVKQQRRRTTSSSTASSMSATDVAAVFANKRNDLEIFVIEPEIMSTDSRSIESTTTTNTATSMDDPSNDSNDLDDDDDDDIDDIQEIQVVDEDIIMLMEEDDVIEEIEDEELALEEVNMVENRSGNSQYPTATDHVVDVSCANASLELDDVIDEVEEDEEVEDEFEVMEADIIKENIGVIGDDIARDFEDSSLINNLDQNFSTGIQIKHCQDHQLRDVECAIENSNKVNEEYTTVGDGIDDITQEDDRNCSVNADGNILEGKIQHTCDIIVKEDVLDDQDIENVKSLEGVESKGVIGTEKVSTTREIPSPPPISTNFYLEKKLQSPQTDLPSTSDGRQKETQQENTNTIISTKQRHDDSLRTSMVVIVDSNDPNGRQLNVLDCQIDTLDSTQNGLQSFEKIEELKSPSQSTSSCDSNSQTDFFQRSDFNSSLIEFSSDNANAESINEVIVQEQQTSLQQVAVESFSDISASSFCDTQQPSSVGQQEQQVRVQLLNDDVLSCGSMHQSASLELVESYMLPSALILQQQQGHVVEKSDCMDDMLVAQVAEGGDSSGCLGYDDDDDEDDDVADGEEECHEKFDSITSNLVNSTNFPCTSRHSTTGGISSFSSNYEDEANEARFLDAETYVLESGQISLDDDDVGVVCSADTTSSSATSTRITLLVQQQQEPSSVVVEQHDEIVGQHDGMVAPGCSKEVDEETNHGTDNIVSGVRDSLFGTVSSDLFQASHHQRDYQRRQIPSTSIGHLVDRAADQDQDEGHGEANDDCCWDDVVDSSTAKLMHSLDSVRVDTSTDTVADAVLNSTNSNSNGSSCDVESPSSESDVGGGTDVIVLQQQLGTVEQQLIVEEVDGEQQLVVEVVGMGDQHIVEDVVHLDEFPVVSVNADWLSAQYDMKINSNNSTSLSSIASVNSVAHMAGSGTTCSISMVPALTSTHTSDRSGSDSGSAGSQNGSSSNSNNSSDMDDVTMEPLHALNNVNPSQLVIVGTTDNVHQKLNQPHHLDNSTRLVAPTSTSITMTGQHNGPSTCIGGSIAANGNVVSTSFPPTVHFTEYMAGNQLKLELEVTLTPEIVNSENMVSSTVGTRPSRSNSPSCISTPTSINTAIMPRLTIPSRSVTRAVSTGILPKTTIVCLPHLPSTSASQYQHEPCQSVETIQHTQQIPASFLHQQQLLLQQQQQQQQATNTVYSVPHMVRAVAATSAAGSAGLIAQMPGTNSNAQLPYLTLPNNITGQTTRVSMDGSTTTSCHKSKKKTSSSSSRSSNPRSISQRDSKPPPPGAVNLERSYQICQAVIQNSPNRDQLRGQLKPPPSALLATATVNAAKAKATAATTGGLSSITAVGAINSSNGGGKSGTVQYASVTTSSNKEGNVSGTFTSPLMLSATSAGNGGAAISSSSTSRLHQGYEVESGGNCVKVKTRETTYAQHKQSSTPVLLRHVFTNNQAMPITLAVLPQEQPNNPEIVADNSQQHHSHLTVTASSSSLGSTPPSSHVQAQQQQYIIVQPQRQSHQRSIGRYHSHQHHLQHVRSSSTNGVPTVREYSSPTALVTRSSSAPPNSHQHIAPSNLLMTTTAESSAPYSTSASSIFSSSFTSGPSLCTSTTKQVVTQPHRQPHLSYLPPLTITNNNAQHHQHNYVDNIVNIVDSHTISNTTVPTTMVVLVNNNEQLQQSNTMNVVQCGPSVSTQPVTRRPRVTSRLLTPQGGSLLSDFGADISSGPTRARLHTTYTFIGGDMEQHPGVAMIQSRANNASHQQQPRPNSGALASGSIPASPTAARCAPVSDSNCPCSLKALAICKKCGAFCHDECISANKLCRTCYIR